MKSRDPALEWKKSEVEGRPDIEKHVAKVTEGDETYRLRVKYDPQSTTSIPKPTWRWQVWCKPGDGFIGGGAAEDQYSAKAIAEQRLRDHLAQPGP